MGDWVKICVIVCGLAALGTPASMAQDQRPLMAKEQTDWPAIGLVFFGARPNGAVCTGTLVAPDLVLTAGHCVGNGGNLASLTFAAGWRQGTAIAIRKARGVVRPVPEAAVSLHGLADDLALIVLDGAIPATEVPTLALLPAGGLAEQYSFLGYQRGASGIIGRTDACDLQGVRGAVLLLGCPVVSGNSGGPLLVWRGGQWQVAAVMVAMGHGAGQAASYAVAPGDDLRARIAAP